MINPCLSTCDRLEYGRVNRVSRPRPTNLERVVLRGSLMNCRVVGAQDSSSILELCKADIDSAHTPF